MLRIASSSNTDNQSAATGFYLIPSAFGLCCGLIFMLLSGFNPVGMAITAGFTISGLGLGKLLLSKHQQQLTATNKHWQIDETKKLNDINGYVLELERLFDQTLPVLSRQVQTSRTHAEQELTVLSKRFASMAEQLNHIISATGHGEDGRRIDSLFSESRAALTAVLQALTQIQSVERAVTEEVRQLSTHTHQLDTMAQEVRKVAEQINLLALNAAIEAARAGENGRGFAVVADEVRKLAGFSSSTGEKISSAIEDINAAMSSTLKMSETSGSQDDIAIRDVEQSIDKILNDLESTLNVFKSDAQALRNGSEQIRDEIFSVLTAFQLKDGVSQMLSRVESNLTNLKQTVDQNRQQGRERRTDMINVETTLNAMELNDSMPDDLLNQYATTGNNKKTFKANNDPTLF